MTTPIRYTSRTFTTIMADINSDAELADKPDWWKRIWAGVGDMLSMILNAQANQSYLRTAFTRQAVADLCELIDYYMTPHSTSSGTLIFYLNADTVAFPKTVAEADIVASTSGSLYVSTKRFEARAGEIVAAFSEGFTAAVDDTVTTAGGRTYVTGEKVRVTTDNTLPPPLAIDTDYYVIAVGAATMYLAESVDDANAGTRINITGVGAGNQTVHLYSFSVTAYQQRSISTAKILGTGDGATEWIEFDMPDYYILRDTVVITINGLVWTRVDSFIDSTATDRHFKMIYLENGASKIRFGDGTYGEIPGVFVIYADYATGGGANSNVSFTNQITVYSGTDSDITGVYNTTTFTGGADEEGLEAAKRIAPMLLKARDRFITVEDGVYLSLNYPGVSQVAVNANVYGLLSAQVVVVPDGGGVPGAGLLTALDTYLTERTILSSIDVRCIAPTYVPIQPTAAAKMLSGYTFANVKPYITLAFRLILTECGQEIYNLYVDDGIIDAVTWINAKWAYTFAEADHDQIALLLTNMTPAEFGVNIEESDVMGFIDTFVDGVDYLTIAAPAFPIVVAVDEIVQDNLNVALITEIP